MITRGGMSKQTLEGLQVALVVLSFLVLGAGLFVFVKGEIASKTEEGIAERARFLRAWDATHGEVEQVNLRGVLHMHLMSAHDLPAFSKFMAWFGVWFGVALAACWCFDKRTEIELAEREERKRVELEYKW